MKQITKVLAKYSAKDFIYIRVICH